MQLILTLRQLDVPIARIKDYLATRSLTTYGELFHERIDFFTKEIARLEAMKAELQKEVAKLDTPHCYEKPEGDYLTLYFQGVYMFNNKKNLQLLADYCREHGLTAQSPLYVTSLCDYWTTGDLSKYVYKLEVLVK